MSAFFWAIIAGVFSGFIGIGYRIGSKGKVFPIQTALILDTAGVLFFSTMGHWQYNMPWFIWGLAILSGLTQYATVRILREALQRGPLSPAWCAVGLSFVPALVYCWFFRGENPTWCQIVSVLATAGAIIAASVGNAKNAESSHKLESRKEGFIYGVLLTAIVVFCGIIYIILKVASYWKYNDGTMLDAFGNQIMAITYLFMMLPTLLDLSLSHTWRINKYFWFGGIFVTLGGIGSYGLQLLIMDAPAVVVFALTGVVSVLFASLTSVFVFHEKRTYYWYATVILAILAVIFNR